ncbi:MAG: hypothetical protein AB7G28_25875 [Pirellulales bacterium]
MLPTFDEFGNLPPGIHRCAVDELIARFGSGSPEREVETKELLDFIAWARTTGIERVIINGSYASAQHAPNDVDIVILPGAKFRGSLDWLEQEVRWPFLQVLVAADDADLDQWSLEDFGTDRIGRSKGVIEVVL